MSLMRLFSGGGEAPRPESNPQQAIDKLRETLDMIEKREKYLEVKIKKELVQAKQLATQGKNQKGEHSGCTSFSHVRCFNVSQA